jgi:hypothetical protein
LQPLRSTLRQMYLSTPKPILDSLDPKEINIALHIRRGDALGRKQSDR